MPDSFLAKWREAALDLGLEIEAPFSLVVGNGVRVEARLLLKSFGNHNGMFIVTDFLTIQPFADEIVAAGYGCSTLSEPSERDRYDRDVWIELLRDWGWAGPEGLRPGWCLPMDEEGVHQET